MQDQVSVTPKLVVPLWPFRSAWNTHICQLLVVGTGESSARRCPCPTGCPTSQQWKPVLAIPLSWWGVKETVWYAKDSWGDWGDGQEPVLTDSSTDSILNLSSTVILIIRWLGTCSVCCILFNNLPDLYPLDALKHLLDPVVSTKMSPDISWEIKITPSWEPLFYSKPPNPNISCNLYCKS